MLSPEEVNFLNSFLGNPVNKAILYILIVWVLVWKGFALWKAAGNKQKIWFIALLVINTLGILEIVYLFYFSKKTAKNEEIG